MNNNPPITCIYGANNNYIDVTSIVQRFFFYHNKLIFPKGHKGFNKYFGDPCFGSVKTLKIVCITSPTNKEYLILENDQDEYAIDVNVNESEESFDKGYFDKNKPDESPLITFIIPTIGRASLIKTLRSIEFQENPRWEVVVVFDGVEPSPSANEKIMSNSKIKHIILDKKLGSGVNSGGLVRNEAFKHVTTEWVGFVDDDDLISSKYVQRFYEESTENPDIDCFVFRMYFAYQVIPDRRASELARGNVGISFCFRTKLFDDGVKFEPSQYEDIALLTKIQDRNRKIMISQYVTYFVKGFMLTPETITILERFNKKLLIN